MNTKPSDSEKIPESQDESQADDQDKKTPMSVILVGIFLTILVILVLQVDDWSRDLTTNFAETSDEATELDLRPIETDQKPEELAKLVVETMKNANRWTIQTDEDAGYRERNGDYEIELVHRTLIIGFKDDVKVLIRPSGSGSRMTVTSQSRVGKGDLGQNPRNIKDLVQRVRGQLESPKPNNDVG